MFSLEIRIFEVRRSSASCIVFQTQQISLNHMCNEFKVSQTEGHAHASAFGLVLYILLKFYSGRKHTDIHFYECLFQFGFRQGEIFSLLSSTNCRIFSLLSRYSHVFLNILPYFQSIYERNLHFEICAQIYPQQKYLCSKFLHYKHNLERQEIRRAHIDTPVFHI